MTRETATGDRHAALAQALTDAGIDTPIGEVEALVRGVAAAAVLDRHWVRLVHPDAEATDALAERLEALRQVHAEAPDGIGAPQQAARLAALRDELARRGLDGFVVPLSDEHQGEYVARRSQRLAWLTGFTGSAGMAIVLAERAALFVDGRYTLQAAAQVDGSLYSTVTSPGSRRTRGSGSIWRPGRRSATTPRCTARRAATGWRRRARPSAHASSPARRTPSTRCGRISRRRRSAPLRPTRCASPARTRARSGRRSRPVSQRRAPRPQC